MTWTKTWTMWNIQAGFKPMMRIEAVLRTEWQVAYPTLKQGLGLLVFGKIIYRQGLTRLHEEDDFLLFLFCQPCHVSMHLANRHP